MMYIILSTLLLLLSVSFSRVVVTAQKLRSNVQPLKNNNRSLQTVVGKVDKLILYNAITDLPILTLTDGMVVNIAALNVNAGSLTVVATTIDGAVGSVKFGYNGKKNQKNEILAPYSLCGDNGANFKACSYLVDGQHTITVTTYEGIKFNGTIGSVETLSFQIVNIPPTTAPTKTPTTEDLWATMQPSAAPVKSPMRAPTGAPIVGKVDTLILYNAITDLPLLALADGMVVNIATLNVNTGSLTVVATTIDGAVGSVKFGYNGKKNQKNEILAPYSLCGDKGADFQPCSYLLVGQHTVTVTTYEGIKFNGTIGSVKTLSFQIVDIPPTMAPTKTPTTEPIVTVATGTPTGTPLKIPTTQPSAAPTKSPSKPPTSAPIIDVSCSIPKFSTGWQGFTPDYPISTPEAQAERIGNDLIAFGGFNSAFTSVTNQSYARDILAPTSPWRRMDDMPIATGITHAATTVIGTKMYMCGGYEGRPPGPHVANCFIYDHSKAPGTGQWSNFTPLPNNGSAGGGMIYDALRNALYYSGGAQRLKRGSREAIDQNHTWKFSFDNPTVGWVETTPIPYTANHLSCVTVRFQGQDRHFFAGGQIGENEKYGNVADTVEFLASTETWVRRTPMPYARSHTTTSMRAIGCGFIVAGGSINSSHSRLQRTSEILYYDIPSDTWTYIGNIPVEGATPKIYIDDNDLLYYIDNRRSSRRALST